MARRTHQGTRTVFRDQAIPRRLQQVAPCDCITSLAFWRVCRVTKRDQLAWLVGFRAGYYGDPYVWPLLGNLDPHVWSLAFIEGRGYSERGL
jgi:hypothetical protein